LVLALLIAKVWQQVCEKKTVVWAQILYANISEGGWQHHDTVALLGLDEWGMSFK